MEREDARRSIAGHHALRRRCSSGYVIGSSRMKEGHVAGARRSNHPTSWMVVWSGVSTSDSLPGTVDVGQTSCLLILLRNREHLGRKINRVDGLKCRCQPQHVATIRTAHIQQETIETSKAQHKLIKHLFWVCIAVDRGALTLV
jgi:hypothetical protein